MRCTGRRWGSESERENKRRIISKKCIHRQGGRSEGEREREREEILAGVHRLLFRLLRSTRLIPTSDSHWHLIPEMLTRVVHLDCRRRGCFCCRRSSIFTLSDPSETKARILADISHPSDRRAKGGSGSTRQEAKGCSVRQETERERNAGDAKHRSAAVRLMRRRLQQQQCSTGFPPAPEQPGVEVRGSERERARGEA